MDRKAMSQSPISEGRETKLLIAFDAYDTLWQNEHYYQQALQQFKSLLSDHNDSAQVEQALAFAKVRNIGWYGYGIKS
jgi:putative hydrolase of the HAD superfamily